MRHGHIISRASSTSMGNFKRGGGKLTWRGRYKEAGMMGDLSFSFQGFSGEGGLSW